MKVARSVALCNPMASQNSPKNSPMRFSPSDELLSEGLKKKKNNNNLKVRGKTLALATLNHQVHTCPGIIPHVYLYIRPAEELICIIFL